MGKGIVSGATSGYGNSDDYGEKKCYPTFETKYRNQCEDYTEKVCYTTHTEKCRDVGSQRCKAMKTSKQDRKCHDVSELLCSLKESVQYEKIPAVFTKQCRPVPKTVCDNADQMSLVPSCAASSRKECSYHPQERCENVPKQHCYQIPYQVKKMECSGGNQAGGYGSQ